MALIADLRARLQDRSTCPPDDAYGLRELRYSESGADALASTVNSDSSVRDGSESLHEIDSRREVTFVEGQGDNGVDPPSSRGSLIVGSSESVQVPSSAISSSLDPRPSASLRYVYSRAQTL